MVDVLVGLQWGDEGKGKIVDILAPQYDIVARFQGGPNAGHTLVINGKKYVLHTVPSGAIHEGVLNVIGSGTVLDPNTLLKELASLEAEGIEIRDRLIISDKAHLILPTHKLLDKYFEESKGEQKIGSTLRGIGPCYQDKYARIGLRAGDILSDDFEKRYNAQREQHLVILRGLGFDEDALLSEWENEWLKSINEWRKLSIKPVETLINQAIKDNKKILAEGAQGSLLDVAYGSYPFVTSSHTLSSAACTGLGIAPQRIQKVFGVFKAYMTRVGSGPFPTELHDERGKTLMVSGNEYGATTGRERRCGWLDLDLLATAIDQNGVTDLIITKSDVLNCLENFSCVDKEGQEVNMPSWSEDLGTIKDFDSLPQNFKDYLSFIENQIGQEINIISTGPDRKQMIDR